MTVQYVPVAEKISKVRYSTSVLPVAVTYRNLQYSVYQLRFFSVPHGTGFLEFLWYGTVQYQKSCGVVLYWNFRIFTAQYGKSLRYLLKNYGTVLKNLLPYGTNGTRKVTVLDFVDFYGRVQYWKSYDAVPEKIRTVRYSTQVP